MNARVPAAIALAVAGALAGAVVVGGGACARRHRPIDASPEAPVPPAESSGAGAPSSLPQALRAIARRDLDVTLGALRDSERGLLVESSKFRAVLRRQTPQVAELDFVYLGPTRDVAPLGSGAVRRQLGLKLRAADGCNLVYVMWRFEPRAQLVVSIKRNPGASTHAQCGNRGYTNVPPAEARPVEAPRPGERHALRAELDGDRLEVRIDGELVWRGSLGEESLRFDGPVGLRSDNVRVAFDLRVP